MTSGHPAATPGRLHAKRIIAWWTPFIPQDKPGILTHQKSQKQAIGNRGAVMLYALFQT